MRLHDVHSLHQKVQAGKGERLRWGFHPYQVTHTIATSEWGPKRQTFLQQVSTAMHLLLGLLTLQIRWDTKCLWQAGVRWQALGSHERRNSIEPGGVWSRLMPSSAKRSPFEKWVLACYEVMIKIECLTMRYQGTMRSELPVKPGCWVYPIATCQQLLWVDGLDFFGARLGCVTPFLQSILKSAWEFLWWLIEVRKTQAWFTGVSARYSSSNQR